MSEWQNLVEADSENDFKISFNTLLARFSPMHPKVIDYVCSTWLEAHKERFISAWIDKCLHLGNSSTNRVEGGHSKLKKFFEVSIGNLTTVWKTFDQMINLQHTEIRRSFGENCIKNDNEFTSILYSELVGKVSLQALQMIKDEEDAIKTGGNFIHVNECSHLKRYTMGLPCAHEILPYIINSKGMPIWFINGHWKQLVLNDRVEVDIEDNIDTELEGIAHKFYDSNKQQKMKLKRKLRELINPTSAQTMEPCVPIKLKGRPNGSNKKFKEDVLSTKRLTSHFEYALLENKGKDNPKTRMKLAIRKGLKVVDTVRSKFGPFWSEHIKDAFDVLGDGHCGFRVIGQALNVNGGWAQVRVDLHSELENRSTLYCLLFGRARYEELLLSLQ